MAVNVIVENVFKGQDVLARKELFNEYLARVISIEENRDTVIQTAEKSD